MIVLHPRFSISLLLIGATIAVGLVLVRPAAEGVRTVQEELALVSLKLEHEEKIVRAFAELKASVESSATDVARLKSALPMLNDKPSNVAELTMLVQDIAEQQAGGVYLQSIRFSDVKRGDEQSWAREFTVVDRTIDIEGIASYESLHRFLAVVSDSLWLLEPRALSFTPVSGQSVVPFALTLRTFVLK